MDHANTLFINLLVIGRGMEKRSFFRPSCEAGEKEKRRDFLGEREGYQGEPPSKHQRSSEANNV
jgi:hypothetical protein